MMIVKTTIFGFVVLVFASLLIAFLVITGCSTVSTKNKLKQNKQLISRMNHEVWNKGNLDILDKLYTSDFVLHFLFDGSESRGIDSLREHVRELRKAFPDWSEKIRRTVAEGDLVVIHYVSTGTNLGRWLGNPPTGKRIQINEVSIFRIEDSKIAEQWLLPDIFSMQQQLAGAGH